MRDKIKWLWSFYRHYPYVLLVLLLLTPVQSAFQVIIPRLFGYAVDFTQTGKVSDDRLAQTIAHFGDTLSLSPETAFGLAFIVIGLVATVLYAWIQTHRAWMNVKLEWLFRQHAFDRITDKGPDFFTHFRTGDLVTRLTDDVAEKLSWFACSGIFRLYEAALAVFFIILMMVSIDPWLTLWTAGPLPLLILIFFKSSSALDRRYDHLQKRISNFNAVIEACFSGVRVIKAYVRENAQQQKFDAAAEDRRRAEIDAVKVTTIVDSLYMYIWQFGVVTVLAVGGYIVIKRGLTIGDLGTFIFYTVWLIFPMFDIGQFLVKSRQSAVSIDRLRELEQFPVMVKNDGSHTCKTSVKPALTLQNVSFGFPGQESRILDGISLSIGSGQTIALVGKVGAGKTWLVNMIPRLVDPTGGNVLLDSIDLRRFTLADLRRNIGYVPQEPVLFSDTVRNNILFGRTDIPDELLLWAVEVAQLKEELAAFPNGLDTTIGTRGMSISGGQKQRLALARALVGKPRLLILDDCTSALDSRTEAALWERLHEVMPDMTAIIITHRPSTLELVDAIYVLEDGRIVEQGTHSELMSQAGHYARIYRRYRLEEEVGSRKT